MKECIALLSFLHQIMLCQTFPHIQMLFPLAVAPPAHDVMSTRARGVTHRHSKQLVVGIHAHSSEQFKRSIFSIVNSYNTLPQSIVDEATVSNFQKRIQQNVMKKVDNWHNIFRDGHNYSSLLRFHAFSTFTICIMNCCRIKLQ